MNYHYIVPSLKNITVTKLAALLLTQEWESKKCVYSAYNAEELSVKDATVEKVYELEISEALKAKIVKYIKPINCQIKKYRLRQGWFLVIESESYWEPFLLKLCWTVNGIIDRKKTAELLIEDEKLDLRKRYVLACVHCLDNHIPKLWNKLPECSQKTFCDKDAKEYKQWNLVVFWSRHINGMELELKNMIDDGPQSCPYRYALLCAVKYGNRVAIEYFLQKLDPKERDGSLSSSLRYLSAYPQSLSPSEYFDEALCYVFLQMSESQQMEALRRYRINIVHRLLNWPWLQFYIPTVRRMQDFLPKKDYAVLLGTIVLKTLEGRRVSKYLKCFLDLWQLTPVDAKRYVSYVVSYEKFLLPHCFTLEDKESIASILSKRSSREDMTSFVRSLLGDFAECVPSSFLPPDD